MRRLLAVALPTLLVSLPPGIPQQGGAQRPTISVETDLVMLPVTVLDRRGRFVPNLVRDQFTVYDNGEPQPIQFFTSEAMPAIVGLVVDCSSSMRGRRQDVTAAAGAFVAAAHPLDQLFSVNFNETVWLGLPGGVVFASSPEQMRQALARAPANGMTALYDAIDLAVDRLERGTHDRKALILISDGGDNASSKTLASVVERVRRADGVIYAITLPDPDDHDAKPAVLRTLARETGGATFTPKNAGEVNASFDRIAGELRSGYTIGLSPPTDGKAGFRSIRVEVNAPDAGSLTVRTRTGYYASGDGHSTR